ncbi:hypothetical protein D3C86_1302920 [compost metagenome]
MEGRQDIVLCRFVGFDNRTADGFLRHVQGDMHAAVRLRRGRQCSQLQRIERPADVAVRHPGNVLQRFLIHLQLHIAKALFRIRQRSLHSNQRMFLGQRLKLEQGRAAEQGTVHIVKRILRRSSNEDDCALLDSGQQRVLP